MNMFYIRGLKLLHSLSFLGSSLWCMKVEYSYIALTSLRSASLLRMTSSILYGGIFDIASAKEYDSSLTLNESPPLAM